MAGKKTITLELTDYVVMGVATLRLWGGGLGEIDMKAYHINEVTDEAIKAGANDNGFGCEKIESITVEIYENYEGYLVFLEERQYEL